MVSIMVLAIIVLAVVPILYSYIYYRKQVKSGEYTAAENMNWRSHPFGIKLGVCHYSNSAHSRGCFDVYR